MLITFKNMTPKVGENCLICDGAKLIGDVVLGRDVSIWYNCVLRGDVNFIHIGDGSNVQDLTTIHVWHKDSKNPNGFPVIIGKNVTIGHNCIIHACKIHDNCLIGMGAIVMDDVEIGNNSIVGAGAVVTKGKKFPPKSLILGSPAKFIRELNDDEVAEIANSAARYIEFKNDYL